MKAIEFANYLGCTPDDPNLDNFLKPFGKKPKFDAEETESGYLVYKKHGLSLIFQKEELLVGENEPYEEGKYILTAVMFYSKGKEGHREFEGELPGGVTFNGGRDEVRKKLGTPFESGGGGKHPILGDVPEWDKFQLANSDIVVHVRYNKDKTKVELVALTKKLYDEV